MLVSKDVKKNSTAPLLYTKLFDERENEGEIILVFCQQFFQNDWGLMGPASHDPKKVGKNLKN